ncbi:programmed cell death protein 7-like [Liolophura sinensis]|uniref:programmed cell death protein 7-like n=1 Tax=Liolophura sinensis TaxID=3198878 RepID=UPI003158DBEB
MAKQTPAGNIPSSMEVGQFLATMRVASTRPETGGQVQPQLPPVQIPPQHPQARPPYQQTPFQHRPVPPSNQRQHKLAEPPYRPAQSQHVPLQPPYQQIQPQWPPMPPPHEPQNQLTRPPYQSTQPQHPGTSASPHSGVESSFQQFQNGRWNQIQPPFTNPIPQRTNQTSVHTANFSTGSPRILPPRNMQGAFQSSNNVNRHQMSSVDSIASQIRPFSQRPIASNTQYQSQHFTNPSRPQLCHPSQSHPVSQPSHSGTTGTVFRPPMPLGSDSFGKEAEQFPQKQQDQDWVDGWLKSLNKKSKPLPAKTLVTIANFKCCLQEAFKLKDELVDLITTIEADLESENFQLKFDQIKKTRLRLETLNKILTDEVTLENIKKLCEKRKTKRERLKRQRQEQYHDRQAALVRREALHRSIDQLQNRLLQQSEQEKQDKEMKAAADRTLSEVRRKLTETSKTVELIKGLRKLRELRCRSIYTKGMYLGMESDNKFERQTESLLTMLENQTKIYETEEKTLKVMLETEQEETKEREREKKRQDQAEKLCREQRQLRQRLFGKDDKLLEGDPLLFYKQFYRQAETSLESLVSVRQGWDMFLVPEHTPGSSTIPQDWVWPAEPSSGIWASVMKQ